MTVTQDKERRREGEIGDRAKRLGRWLARFAFDEGQSIDELKWQLPPLRLVTSLKYRIAACSITDKADRKRLAGDAMHMLASGHLARTHDGT